METLRIALLVAAFINLIVLVYLAGKYTGKLEMLDEMLKSLETDFRERNKELIEIVEDKKKQDFRNTINND